MDEPQRELIRRVVKLGQLVRQQRAEGRLLSVPPPTLHGYLTFLRMAKGLAHLAPEQIAQVTILGTASPEDQKLIPGLLNVVFGLQQDAAEEDPTLSRSSF
jgi:hypothetical protein